MIDHDTLAGDRGERDDVTRSSLDQVRERLRTGRPGS
jgi:hypothetical protein